jgi:hypothetical protein
MDANKPDALKCVLATFERLISELRMPPSSR